MSIRSEVRKYMWRVHRRFRDTATVRTRQGRFTISLRDKALGKRLYCRGQYELDWSRRVLAFLRAERLIPPAGEGCVLDIGANVGIISIGMLNHGEFARAVAVEPEPLNYELLERNVAQNGLADRCACLPVAVSDKPGHIELELSAANFGDHRVRVAGETGEAGRHTVRREAATLDDLAARGFDAGIEEVSLVWMDVQGHEGYVIRGGRAFFKTAVPVMSEVWPVGLRAAGMDNATFAGLAAEVWTDFFVDADGAFDKRPIGDLEVFLDQLESTGAYANVIFVHGT